MTIFELITLYNRCIGSNTCAAINGNDPVKNDKPENTGSVCCQGLNPNMQCQPDCVGQIQNRERALSSDVGFYRKFQVHESGRPMGCPAFDDRFLAGQRANSDIVDCGLEDFAPEGQPLYQIVEEMAASNADMMKDFLPGFEKMLENGYTANELNPVDLSIFDFN